MGLSSSTTKTENKPIYGAQLEQMAGNINSSLGAVTPKITAITDQLGTLAPGLMKDYANGDPGVNAARGYNTDVLSGKYLDAGNPYLESMIAKATNDARNQTSAALGVRGLNGGSSFNDIVSRNSMNAGLNLRYQDYGQERSRMDSAAGQAAGLSAAQYLPIGVLQQIAQSQGLPLQAATGAAAATGGLLGSYTQGTTTQGMNLFQTLLGSASNAAKAIAGAG